MHPRCVDMAVLVVLVVLQEDSVMDKSQLRKYVRSQRPRETAASGVWAKVEALEEFRNASTVLAFWSLPDEIDTHEIVVKWASAKRMVLPKVVGDSLVLRAYEPLAMAPGAYGILEPTDEAPEVDPSEIDLAIIPGVAFDVHGHRLGRGKGYYDRLMPELSCPKLGVALPYQIVDEVPVEDHDIPVDKIIY